MKNRHGDDYKFRQLDENSYALEGDLKWWRFGSHANQLEVDYSDLGFVDPAGGPFIGIGSMVEGREVVAIRKEEGAVIITVCDV